MHVNEMAPAVALVIAAALGTSIASPAGAAAQDSSAAHGGLRLAQAPAPSTPEMPASMELTGADVEGFMRIVDRVRELGVRLGRNPDGSLSFGDSAAARNEAMSILNSSGFTPERLDQVAFNIGMAMAALEADMDEIKRNLQQYEQMKAQMPPEQWAALEASLGQAYRMMERIQDQPPGNIALVERYRSELRESLDMD